MSSDRIYFKRSGAFVTTVWNGKTFQAVRMIAEDERDGFVTALFAQLAGSSNFAKEDLPDPKKWTLLRTKARGRVVFTVWRKDLTNYECSTEAKSARLRWLFVGPTTAGAWFFALRHLVRITGIGDRVTFSAITEKAKELAGDPEATKNFPYEAVAERGDIANEGVSAVLVRWEMTDWYTHHLCDLFGIERRSTNDADADIENSTTNEYDNGGND
ncbi:hypothetical protein K8I61_17380 [bacterium]|nr:hypothetical protein [bacterium]